MSKGNKRRPRPDHVTKEEFDRQWDETFGDDQKELINPDQSETLPEPNGQKQLQLPFESHVRDENWEERFWRDAYPYGPHQ